MIGIENVNKFMFEKIEDLIGKGYLQERKIILFGLNASSYAAKCFLEKKGYSIYAYIDNDQKKRDDLNEYLDEIMPRHMNSEDYAQVIRSVIRAYKPEELLSEYEEQAVILIASKYYRAMCEQLEKMGYQENKHIFQTVDFFALDRILKQDVSVQGLKELEHSEIQQIQIKIAEYLKETCKKHNLRYYMTGGTLLGAVRHKGYIPWDDDIDMTMPMPDYLRLIDILKEDEHYEVLSIYNYPDIYFNFFMRLIDKSTLMKTWEYPFLMTTGVSIDVFPLIGLPENKKDVQAFFNRIRNLNTRYVSSFISFSEEDEEVKQYREKLRKEVIQMMEQYNFDQCEQAGYILSRYWEKDIMPRSIYDGETEMKFENTAFAAPTGYREYLGRIFGDYMKLPPESEQKPHHNYKAYHLK